MILLLGFGIKPSSQAHHLADEQRIGERLEQSTQTGFEPSKEVQLPSTIAYIPPDNLRHPDYKPVPPADQAIPVQEPGLRPARAVPYRVQVRGEADFSDGTVKIHFGNFGTAAAVYQKLG